MDLSLEVTDQRINELKSKIDAQQKINEYNKLKNDLFDITYKANNALTEFNSGMQEVDTERTLKSRRDNHSFSDLMIGRIIKMCNVRPIVGNLIAIGLTIVGLIFIMNFLKDPDLKSIQIGLTYLLESAAAVQVLKSASRSIVLPLVTIAAGAFISNHLLADHTFLNHTAVFFQTMMIVGVVGVAISVFAID